jgi:hypothetical protein
MSVYRFLIGAGMSGVLAFSATVVQAERVPGSGFTGTALLQACDAQDVSERAYCRGYIEGIADAVLITGARSPIAACIPPSVTVAQIVDTTVEYLHDHPREVRSYAGAVLVLEAMRKAFRCRQR